MIGRHAFGDQYRASELNADEPGKFEIVFTPKSGNPKKTIEVIDFPSPGVGLAM